MIPIKLCMSASAICVLAACSGADPEPKTANGHRAEVFTYAPTLNKPHRETVRLYQEVAIPGTPLRDTETWTLDWEAVTSSEANQYKRTLKLVGLKVVVNDVEELRGDEVKANNGAAIDVFTDGKAKVLDVRGADQLSAAVVALGDPALQPALRQSLSPARLKALAVMRTTEQHADFVGRPTQVGSTWAAVDANGTTRNIRIVSEEPCGATRCLKVIRTYEVDKKEVFEEAARRVAAYVQQQGGNPDEIDLVDMNIALEDSLLIDPATMNGYGALLVQDATLRLASPSGELPVSFKTQREVVYTY